MNQQVLTFKDLGIEIPDIALEPQLLAQCVRVLRQNWRQGTVACKDRSKVTSRSNRKPWKQKGTGRARAGSARSPLWRGGGVTHGPQARVRKLSVTQSMRRHVFLALAREQINKNRVFVLDWTPAEAPSTAQAAQAIRQAGFADTRLVLFAAPHDHAVQVSCANIPSVQVVLYDEPNAVTLARDCAWVILKKDQALFADMVGSWI